MASIKKDSNEEEFLLLHHTAGHWDFPKGNIEVGEDELGAARREIFEETGIQVVNFLEGFRKKIEYQYTRGGILIQKEVGQICSKVLKPLCQNNIMEYMFQN